jgi:hypothetical protein
MWLRVAAALVCAAMVGCAQEDRANPASIEPSTYRSYPLPPVKPERPQSSGLQAVFTESIPFARTL